MALGVWGAWVALTYSGSLWVSDYLTEGWSLARMHSWVGGACALVLAALALASRRGHSLGDARRAGITGGLLMGVGCATVILIGPFYLGAHISWRVGFPIGSCLAGAGLALLVVRCGALYGSVSPRAALLYAAESQLVAAFIYFALFACPQWAPVERGPSLAGILTFCLLPVLAGALMAVTPRPAAPGQAAPQVVADGARITSRPFWKFVVFLGAISAIGSFMRAGEVVTHSLASTVDGSNVLMLLRVVMALGLLAYAVRAESRAQALGTGCSVLVVVSAVAMACASALDERVDAMSLVVAFCVNMLDVVGWCLIAFFVVQKRAASAEAYGWGYGALMLGSAVGWLLGGLVLPDVLQWTPPSWAFLVLAGVALVLAFVLFSERDCMRLFAAADEGPSLEDLFDEERRRREEERLARSGKRGRFSRALADMAREYRLTEREAEVLRCLAMGYGNERVAHTLGVKGGTARTHTHNVYAKLGVHTREQLMRFVDEAVARQPGDDQGDNPRASVV